MEASGITYNRKRDIFFSLFVRVGGGKEGETYGEVGEAEGERRQSLGEGEREHGDRVAEGGDRRDRERP